MKKIYIAGKITENPTFQEDFKVVADREEEKGNKVMNPAKLSGGFTQGEYMRICFAMIDACEAILLLSNWTDSDGAKLEKAYAEKTGKKIYFE